jgi:hypothetical protein
MWLKRWHHGLLVVAAVVMNVASGFIVLWKGYIIAGVKGGYATDGFLISGFPISGFLISIFRDRPDGSSSFADLLRTALVYLPLLIPEDINLALHIFNNGLAFVKQGTAGSNSDSVLNDRFANASFPG